MYKLKKTIQKFLTLILIIFLTITLSTSLYIFYRRYVPKYLYETELYTEYEQKCSNNSTEASCKANANLCNFDKNKCMNNCQRKKCANIEDADTCTVASTTNNQFTEPSCAWSYNNCRDCAFDYVLPDGEPGEYSCFENRCDGLSEDFCKSAMFSNKCCWNNKKNKCECSSKKQDAKTKQCIV